MKKTIYTLLFLLMTSFSFSQNLICEISICWEKNSEFLFTNSNNVTPFLHIKFKNLTEENIYFKDPFSSIENGIPKFPSSIHKYYSNRTIDEDSINFESKYVVEIGAVDEYSNLITVLPLDIVEEEFEMPFINDYLGYIYESIRIQRQLNLQKEKTQLVIFNYPGKDYIKYKDAEKKVQLEKENLNYKIEFSNTDFVDKKEFAKIKDKFCFLKKGESFEKKINLIGFKLIGGEYNFGISFDNFTNFVRSSSSLEKNANYNKIPLPKKVNEYQLYSNKIISNRIIVNF